MSTIPAMAQTVLGSDAVAHVWTRNPDGSPQVSVVWVSAQDDEILFGTDAGSPRARSLAREDRVGVSIVGGGRDVRGDRRRLGSRGRAQLEPGPDPALMDRLAMKYTSLKQHPLALRDSPTSVVVRVRIDRLSGVGPWIDDTARTFPAAELAT